MLGQLLLDSSAEAASGVPRTKRQKGGPSKLGEWGGEGKDEVNAMADMLLHSICRQARVAAEPWSAVRDHISSTVCKGLDGMCTP